MLQGFLGLTCSALDASLPGATPPFHLRPSHVWGLASGLALGPSTATSGSWACKNVWASKGPNAFVSAPGTHPQAQSLGSVNYGRALILISLGT